MLNPPEIGTELTMVYRVRDNKTVPDLYPEEQEFQAMPRVFATGFTVGLLEWAAMKVLEGHTDPTDISLGTMVNIKHSAPTPPGAELTVTAKLIKVNKGYAEFEVRAVDGDGDVAAEGTHGRNVVDRNTFMEVVEGKRERLVHPDVSDVNAVEGGA